jgi:hypothetical protein
MTTLYLFQKKIVKTYEQRIAKNINNNNEKEKIKKEHKGYRRIH